MEGGERGGERERALGLMRKKVPTLRFKTLTRSTDLFRRGLGEVLKLVAN